MANILISSLGTGKKDGEYQKATYEIDGKQYNTSFVADALNKHKSFDKIYLIGTNKSIWDEAYLIFGGEDSQYHEILYSLKEAGKISKETLNNFDNLKKGLEAYIIDYGINDDQLWSNFEKFLEVAENIEDGDEVYLDVTHSFRSLSLMSFVMTQFASSISDKNFKVSGVYYGMLEYSNDNNGITPIVDIKLLLEIQEWIKAIDAIKKYSDFDPLVKLLEDDKTIEESVNKTFINLNNNINLANIFSIRQFIHTSSKKIKSLEDSSNKIIRLLVPEVLQLVNTLDLDLESDFQYELSKWFYNNKNYALSYIALYEAIITKSCELSNYDITNRTLREDAKSSIGDDKYGKYFYTKYDDSISVIRNTIVHQSSDRTSLVANDISKLDKFINFFEAYFEIGK